MGRDLAKAAFWVALLVALLAGSAWMRFAAPCSAWSYSPAKDVPARCIAWVHH